LIGFHFSHSSGRSDKDIRAAIESDLRKDPVLHYADLSTMVKDGAVTLTGEVHGDLDRTRAAAVAAREDGVRQVTNDLRVALPIVEGNAKVHASRSDDDILRAIESILQNDPVLQYAEVRVAVEAGDVTLAGEVHEDSDRIRAANIATRQVGVRHVINKLQLPELIADNKGASRLPARTPAMAPAGSAFGSHGGVGGQRSVPAPQSPSGPQAGVPAPQIPSGPQTEKVFLRDDFTSDRFLNDFQWVTSGEVLNARILKADTRFVPVQLAFTSSGMVMAGVNGKYQSTGIQSKRSFSAPLTLSATVMGTISNGNPIAFYLVSADGAQYLAVNCNLAGRNDSYSGASFGFTGRGDSGNQKSEAFLHEVSVRTWYLIRFVIDEGGTGTVTIQDRQGTLLAQRGNLYVGTGPFFVVLAQWAGWPHTVGPNEAVWASVLLSVPQSAKSSSRSHEQR